MSEPVSFTPGPWEYDLTPEPWNCNWVKGPPQEDGCFENPADARLIAAAPALYAALAEMVTATHAWNEAVQDIIGRQPRTGIDLEHARAALALARGEGKAHGALDELAAWLRSDDAKGGPA